MQSPRSWLTALGWAAATLSSVSLAWVAMQPVLHTAAPDESALVSAEQLRNSGEAEPTTPSTAPAGPSGAPRISTPATATSRPSPSASSTPSRTRTTGPGPGGSPAGPGGTPTTTEPPTAEETTPPPDRPAALPSTTTEDGWTVTTGADGERTYVRSFRVEGGQTVIRMTEGRVRLVTATPADGYAVATVQNEPDNLAVYFNEVGHSFVIHAVWFNDKPFAEVSEIGE